MLATGQFQLKTRRQSWYLCKQRFVYLALEKNKLKYFTQNGGSFTNNIGGVIFQLNCYIEMNQNRSGGQTRQVLSQQRVICNRQRKWPYSVKMHAIYFGLARSLFTGQKKYFYMINTKNCLLKGTLLFYIHWYIPDVMVG